MLDTFFWKKYFKTYDVLNSVIPYIDLTDKIVELVNANNEDVILDAGAGTGNIAIKLVNSVKKIFALDSSKEGLDIAKNKSDKIQIVLHSLTEKLPFEDQFFTKIISNNVIYTLPVKERDKIFSEFYRVLKPGGRIIVSNVRDGWKPINIYKSHIKSDLRNAGILKVLFKIIYLLPDTLKMFYYNGKIKKENKDGDYDFLKPNEQRDLLVSAGFINVSSDLSVYADQAILNYADKA